MACTTCVTPPQELVGYGAMLRYCDPQTLDWVLVGGTKDLETPQRTIEAIDTTSNDGDGWKTFMPSPIKNLETVTYTIDFLVSQWKRINQIAVQGLFLKWQVVLNNPQQTYIQFCAFISETSDAIPMEDLVTSDITLQPSGAPVFGELN